MASFINTSYSYQSMFQERPVRITNSLQSVDVNNIIAGGVKGALPGQKPVNYITAGNGFAPEGQPVQESHFSAQMKAQEIASNFRNRREREREAANREQNALLRIKNLAFSATW